LIEAIKILKERGFQVLVNLTGKGTKSDLLYLKSKIKTHDLEFNFKFHGYLSRKDYIQMMVNSDILCMNRINSEYSNSGFPFKLIEMLASGNIVLSSKLKSVENYFTEDDLIFVEPEDSIDLANKIESIINKPEYYRKIAENGNKKCFANFNMLKYDLIALIPN